LSNFENIEETILKEFEMSKENGTRPTKKNAK